MMSSYLFKKFINDNKVLLTGLFLISLIILSYFLKDAKYLKIDAYLKSAGCLGLACFIVNWLVLEILLEKISFLYTIDKIRNYIEPIKNFLINDIFGVKNFDDLKNEYKKILTEDDKNKIEKNIDSLTIDNLIKVFSNDKFNTKIKQSILEKISEIESVVKNKVIDELNSEEKLKSGQQFFKEEILPVIENKLEMSVLSGIQSSMYETVKDYFEWLVLWGAYCGAILGLLFRFMGCL